MWKDIEELRGKDGEKNNVHFAGEASSCFMPPQRVFHIKIAQMRLG